MRYPEKVEKATIIKREIQKLTFDNMTQQLYSLAGSFPDKRTGKNLTYGIEDVAMGAFSLFFTQSPSFLAFQKTMEKTKGKSNAQTMFGMNKIPCDNHIRDIMDDVHPSHIFPMFSYIFSGINKSGILDTFRCIGDNILIALDGTRYFSSDTIHCENCSIKKHRNGKTAYSHSAVTPVVVMPGDEKVIPLEPEFVTPQDGHTKQDCENTAARRWLRQHGPIYKEHRVTVLGDDLYSRQPLCEAILKEGLNFILVCKPDSHKTLYEWVKESDAMQEVRTVTVRRWTGKRRETDTYRFANRLPLRDGEDALEVNRCELATTLSDGTVVYRNSFVTNHVITEKNVSEIAESGRARWKTENENNNVLKNRGYHLEHNFGHGKKHLSSLMLTLNLPAFLFHTVLDMTDSKYKQVRKGLPTRKTFFDDVRALTRYICFESWEDMLNFMLKGLEIKISDTS